MPYLTEEEINSGILDRFKDYDSEEVEKNHKLAWDNAPGYRDLFEDQEQYAPGKVQAKGSVAPERGFVGDVVSNLARGTADLARMGGYALKTADPDGGIDFVEKVGQGLVDMADKSQSLDIMRQDEAEAAGEGFLSRGWKGGVRSAVPSLAPVVTGGLAGSAFGPLGALIGAGVGTLGLFGLGVYGEKLHEYEQAGVPKDEREKAAFQQALVEGGIETASSLIGLKIFGVDKFITQPLKNTVKELLETPLSTWGKNLVKDTFLNEIPTEMLQEALGAGIETNLGLQDKGAWKQAAAEAIIPAMTMSLMFGMGAGGLNVVQKRKLKGQLNDIENPDARMQAVETIETGIREHEKTGEDSEYTKNAESWANMAMDKIESGETIDLSADFVEYASQDQDTLNQFRDNAAVGQEQEYRNKLTQRIANLSRFRNPTNRQKENLEKYIAEQEAFEIKAGNEAQAAEEAEAKATQGDPDRAEDQYWKSQKQEILNQQGTEQFKRGMQGRDDLSPADRHGNPAYSDTSPFDYGEGDGPVPLQNPKQEAFVNNLIEKVGSYDAVAELYPDNDAESQSIKTKAAEFYKVEQAAEAQAEEKVKKVTAPPSVEEQARLDSIEKSVAALERRHEDMSKAPTQKESEAAKNRPFAALESKMREGLPVGPDESISSYDDGIDVDPNAEFTPTEGLDDYRFQKGLGENVSAQNLLPQAQDLRTRVSELKQKKNLSKKNQKILENFEVKLNTFIASPAEPALPFTPLEGKQEQKKQAVAVAPEKKFIHDHSSTQVNIQGKEANGIRAFAKKIPDAELYTEPGDSSYGREDNPHITVKYGLKTNNPKDVATIIDGHPPITAKMGKVSIFENDKYDVVKVELDSPELHAINKKIEQEADISLPKGETFDYTPYATIAYVKHGEGKKYIGDKTFAGKEITFDALTVFTRDGELHQIPLSGKPAEQKADVITGSQNQENDPQTGLPLTDEPQKDGALIYRVPQQYDIEEELSKASEQDIDNILDDVFGPVPESKPAAKDMAKKVGIESLKGVQEATKGLASLFTPKNTLGSGLVVNEETYQAAKPHFEKAWAHAKEAGFTLKELVQHLAGQFDSSIRPYLKRFLQEKASEPQKANLVDDKPAEAYNQENQTKKGDSDGRNDTGTVKGDESGKTPDRRPESGTGLGEPSSVADGQSTGVDKTGVSGTKENAESGTTEGDEGSSPEAGDHDNGRKVVPGSDRGSDKSSAGPTGRPGDHGRKSGTYAGKNKESDLGVESKPSRSGNETLKEEDKNHVIGTKDVLFPGGTETKIKSNIKAIRLLKKLEKENRNPTPAEKKVLAQYVGWGAFAQKVFKQEFTQHINNPGYLYGPQKEKYEAWRDKYGKHLHPDLGGLLTLKEWVSARESTTNAHYTSKEVVQSVWDLIEHLGFKGGHVLEPSAGVGHFFGLMPKGMAKGSAFHGVEFDALTGGILTKLYPKANIQVTGFEKAKGMAKNSMDLVISNFPFGKYSVVDKSFPEYGKWSVHNYFFGKSIDLVRPGGLVVGITSHYTLDAVSNGSIRKTLGEKADFIGAVRLPGTAFKKDAGTEVTTDIIVFRKKDGTEQIGNRFRLSNAIKIGNGEAAINEYFIENPDMVLGKNSLSGSMYGSDEYTVTPNPGKIENQINEAIAHFPQGIIGEGKAKALQEIVYAGVNNKEGTLTQKDGKLLVVENGQLVTPKIKNSKGKIVAAINSQPRQARAKAYTNLRDRTAELIDEMQNPAQSDENLDELRQALESIYDDFVKKFNRVNSTANSFLRTIDNDFPIIDALENEVIVIDENGKQTKEYSKADILKKRTIFPFVEPKKADSMADALPISMVYKGRIDAPYIAELTGQDEAQVRTDILEKEIGYVDPATGMLDTPDKYLSGNVKKKLIEAEKQATEDPAYQKNVDALKAVQPEDIDIDFIFFKLGSSWIPDQAVQDFIKHLTDLEVNVKQVRTEDNSSWAIEKGNWSSSAKNTSVWGAPGANAIDLIKSGLNLKRPKIYMSVTDPVSGKNKGVHDKEASMVAQKKQDEIQEEFRRWAKKDEKWAGKLTEIYNLEYNGFKTRQFDIPDIKQFPGASPAITLRPLQIKAVCRCLQESTLLSYGVGTGKTFTFVSLAMEMRRLKTASKPMIVVQGSTVGQFKGAFKLLYPQAKVLIPNDNQRSAKNRKKLLAQVATGDWDAVVVPHSFFDGIADDPAREQALVQEQLDELDVAMAVAAEAEGKNAPSVKQMETAKKKKRAQIEKLQNRRTDDTLTFEQMGVDALLIDEAHSYKRSEFSTKMGSIKGIDSGASQKSSSLILKSNFIREKTGNKNIILATGTPISNTTAELWTMIRYVKPELLGEYGVSLFDDFAANFGDTSISTEETDTGDFKEVERFNKFTNGPELITLFHSASDVVLTKDAKLDLPDVRGGKSDSVVIQRSPELGVYIDELRDLRASFERMTGKQKMKNRHIPLLVYGRAKKAAVDLRMIDPRQYKDDPNGKLSKVADNVYDIWHRTADKRSTQAIFLDIYKDSSGTFNAYHEIRRKLVEKGVPQNEVIIISDARNDSQKEAAFQKIRTGKARVIIGSTSKLGVGVNMQDKLVAAHHVDVPQRPMDIEQRNGRIVREGNENKIVDILNYGVKNTLDSVMYDRLIKKQKFIDQMLSGKIDGRSFDDPLGDEQISFAEMNAAFAGNPLLFEKSDVTIRIKELQILEHGYIRQMSESKRKIRGLVRSISNLKQEIVDADAKAEYVKNNFPENNALEIEYKGDKVSQKEFISTLNGIFNAQSQAIIKLYGGKKRNEVRNQLDNEAGRKEIKATFNGHDVKIVIRPSGILANAWSFGENNKLVVGGNEDGMDVTTSFFDKEGKALFYFSGKQLTRGLNKQLDTITKSAPANVKKQLYETERDLTDLKEMVEQDFKHGDELVEKRDRLDQINKELEAGPADKGTEGTETPGEAKFSISSVKPWPKDFPNVTVHTTANKVAPNKKGEGGHPDHKAAKAGNVDAANRLVFDLVKPEKVLELKKQFPDAMVVPVHAEEDTGRNKIPRALARAYGEIAGFKVDLGIVQINKSGHTKKDAAERIISRAEFGGEVIPGQEYIVLDDIITTGETLSELRHYIENNGGSVVVASTLGYSKYSTVLAVKQDSLNRIQDKFNVKELEDALKDFNIAGNIQALTNSEARYILSFKTVDAFRNRILKAGRHRSGQSQYSVFQGEVRGFQEKTRNKTPTRKITLPGQGLSLDQIKSQYPDQQITTNKDGTLSISFKNGRGVKIKTVDHIGGDDVRFAMESGRMQKDGLILGKYQDGTITLNQKAANLETVIHENFHALVDMGIIAKADLKVLDNLTKMLTIQKKYRYDVLDDVEENRANTLAQIIADRKEYREGSGAQNIIQKVLDFLDALIHIYSQSARKLAREYETGKVYNRLGKESEQKTTKFQVAGDTYSSDFKKWFGKSVAKNKAGEPVPFYHGTPNAFTVFEDRPGESTTHTSSGLGHFFTMDRAYAKNTYAKEGGNVIEAYLKMEKPYKMSLDETQSFETLTDAVIKKRKLRLRGYDSVIIPVPGAQPMISIFSSGQIKSVLNKGGWDSNNPDIRFSTSTDTVPAEEKKEVYNQILSGMKNVFANRKNKGPNYKKDIGVIENMFGLMSHYSEKIPALQKTFEELLKRPEWKFQKENELYKNGEESMVGTLSDLQKHNKSAYTALKGYLVNRDINQIGPIVFQDTDGTWTIKSPKDERTGKRSIIEKGLSTKKEARDLAIEYEVDEYHNQAGKDALRAFRAMTANLHDFYAESWESIIQEYEERGLTLPDVVTRTKGGEVRINLKAALSQMGDRSSYYFPRQRSNGDWMIIAKKDGDHDFIEYRDFKKTADFLAGKMKAKGYTVQVEKTGSMSEDVYQNVKSILSTQAMVNQALSETKLDTKLRTLKDLGLKGEWRKDDYVVPNGGVYEWSDAVLKKLGGQPYSDLGRMGNSWSPGYRFDNAPKDMHEIVTNAMFMAQGQETDVSFEIAKSLANQLADELRSRGSRARMISRSDAVGKDVSVGYETDPIKAIAQAVNSAAGGFAKQQVALNTSKAITGQHYTWNEWQRQHPDYDALTAAEDDLKSLQKNSKTENERIAAIDMEIKEFQRERVGVKTESEAARQDRLFRIGTLFREKEKIRKWKDKDQAAAAHQEIARLRGGIHKGYREYIQANMIDPKRQKRAYTDAVSAVENVLKNDEAGDRVINTLKGMASVWFLGGRLSSAAINLTAMGTTVPAAMNAYGDIPLKRTIQHIAKAGKVYTSFVTGKGKVSKGDRDILEDIFSRGWVAAQLNMETVNALKSGPGQKYSKAVELLMTPFKVTEEFNRGTTLLAAYKGVMAENPGMDRETALEKAKKVSDRAHGIYGLENQPALLRKGSGLRAASAMYIFQTFIHNYFTTLAYMIGRKQAGAAIYMMLSPVVFGGAASSILLPAVKMIFKALGEDDPEEKIYQVAKSLFGETGGDVARYGLPGLAGVSFKGSLAPNMPDFKEPLDVLGPIGGMMRNIYQGGQNLTRGDYLKGIEKITPLAVGNIAKAVRETTDGVTTRLGDPVFFGNEQVRGDLGTGIMRAAGMNPTKIAKPREIKWNETTRQRQYAERKRNLYSRIVRYHAQKGKDKNQAGWQDIVSDILKFNARVKSNSLTNMVSLITTKTIKSRIRRAFRPNMRERRRSRSNNRYSQKGITDND